MIDGFSSKLFPNNPQRHTGQDDTTFVSNVNANAISISISIAAETEIEIETETEIDTAAAKYDCFFTVCHSIKHDSPVKQHVLLQQSGGKKASNPKTSPTGVLVLTWNRAANSVYL